METLQAIRRMGSDGPILDYLTAFELAQDSGSTYVLSEHSGMDVTDGQLITCQQMKHCSRCKH